MSGPQAPAPVTPVSAAPAVPPPRRPPGARGSGTAPSERLRRWYEETLGWPTEPGAPLRLRVGVRFDVLDVPADAGRAALERLGRSGPAATRWARVPVAVRGARMQLLVAAGGAEELPGLLEWLEWGSLPLGLSAVGTGASWRRRHHPATRTRGRLRRCPRGQERAGPPAGCAPGAGGEAAGRLPALTALGGTEGAPDLARLVHTLATQCHRVRLGAGTGP
ncbi:SCO3374 family protein [Streptomyces sp. NBUA17]|uniref:SCO3374 family protein n=1 Tax=Streptomyces sp. NBUA17 TaxID=3062275 RepID=UPI0037DA2F8B